MNQLILGDNLEIMRKMDSESIDLIYLDPPFFSNRNYEVIWGDKGEVRSFEDRWSGGVDHYIAWLKERVAEMHRLLKPTGSIYLHCDWHADAYIRVFILDKIFGESNFNSSIIWERTTNSGSSKGIAKKFPNDHDTIYFYSKDLNKTFFKPQFKGYSEDYIKHYYIYDDKDGKGRYQVQALKTYSEERLEKLKSENRIVPGKGKLLRFKDYLNDKKGVPINTIWADIEPVNPIAHERIGYPTQKPEKLLERIINASSNEGDTVFDPFVGGGTTVVVADKLKRNWIGIDQSVQAVKVSEMRLNNGQNLFSAPFSVTLHKYDYDTLRYKDAFEFEKFIVEQFGGLANIKQRSDLGLDGRTREGSPIQVKRSDNIGRNVIDNFHSAVMRYDKALYEKNKAADLAVGYIIAFTFGKGAIQEVARLKNEENVEIKLVTVEEIIPIAKKPKLSVKINDLGVPPLNPLLSKEGKESERSEDSGVVEKADSKKVALREIEFIAIGESDAGVEFYSWDFEYNEEEKKFKASIMLDKEGRQQHKFKPGTHSIAVKAVDNEGLEAIEVVKVKVNGVVERG
ncbi:MAG: site-specific DNA-methyltransferase [Candidatus Kapabacteria bacterium]|nr:site-specific DNA-methyltransferase [Candidatus Kapabacteria bacterium]